MHFIILKLNVHKIKLNQDSKMANFNYKVQNYKCSKIKYSLFWNRTTRNTNNSFILRRFGQIEGMGIIYNKSTSGV